MIAVAARQASLVAFKQKCPGVICSTLFKAVSSQTFRFDKTRTLSTHYRHDNDSDVDYNDYEGQRFSKDFEEMRIATDAIEHSLEQLKETRARHLKIVEGGGIPNSNLQDLLEASRNQEAVLSNQLQILKEYMVDANPKLFAVDSPDGTSDFESKIDRAAVDEIINSASKHEDVDAVLQSHQKDREDHKRAMKTVAVDGPDGYSDDEMMVEKESVQNIIDYAAEHENAYKVLKEHEREDEIRDQNRKTVAVDGPDGYSDDEMMVDKESVQNIIDYAAEHENVDKVLKEHEREDEIRDQNRKVVAVDAPDGMSDDELEVDMEAVDNIITFASEHEDAQEVELRHERERRDYVARMKRINDEHDW